jgi:arabinofuranosyltransferase
VSPHRLFLLVAFVLAGLLALHAWHYWPFLSDEALVSLRYAMRFTSGQGLTWTDGERVEGYTNFLWVVLTGVIGKLGLGFVPAARLLGFLGVLLAIACVSIEPRSRVWSLPRLIVGGALIVSTAPFAIWSIGGLEQGLLVGLLALSLRALEHAAHATDPRRVWRWGVPLALLALVRADGALLVASLLAGSACLPTPSVAAARRTAIIAIPSGVAVLAHLGFRLAYYGEFLPNSANVKLVFTTEHLVSGLEYVGRGYASASMLVLVAIIATVFAFRRGERFGLVMPWSVVVSWTVYVAVVGGDIFPGFRQLVPSLLALCFLVADEVAADWDRIVRQRVLVLPVLGLCIVLHATQGTETAENRRARGELSEWDGQAIGEILKTAFGSKQPLLAVDRAGALPFWSELPSLDMLGPNDRHIAATEPHDFGAGQLGHEFGDGKYVLRRAPDLVVFNEAVGSATPTFRSGRELVRLKEFQKSYQWINVLGTVEERRIVGTIWVRREKGKLGVVRTDERVVVPGYFFTGQASSARSVLDEQGVLVAGVSVRRPGVLPELFLPAGRYELEFSPPAPALVIDVRCRDMSMQKSGPAGAHVIEIDGTTPITIAVAPPFGARGHRFRSASLTRVPNEPPTLRCSSARSPLRLSATALKEKKPARTVWSHPSNVVFTSQGAIVDLGARPALSWFEVSLSQNDGYLLELRQGKNVVWTTSVERKRSKNAPLLRNHRFDLPKPLEGATFELVIRPRKGDAPCSIGHVELG